MLCFTFILTFVIDRNVKIFLKGSVVKSSARRLQTVLGWIARILFLELKRVTYAAILLPRLPQIQLSIRKMFLVWYKSFLWWVLKKVRRCIAENTWILYARPKAIPRRKDKVRYICVLYSICGNPLIFYELCFSRI